MIMASNFTGAAPKPYRCKICQTKVTDFEFVIVTAEGDSEVAVSIDYTVQPCGHAWNMPLPHA
jgi:hypothetical protein